MIGVNKVENVRFQAHPLRHLPSVIALILFRFKRVVVPRGSERGIIWRFPLRYDRLTRV